MSTTAVIELQDVGHLLTEPSSSKIQHPPSAKLPAQEIITLDRTSSDLPNDALPSPTTAYVEQKQRWNHPRSNMFKTFATFWSFIVLGMNDAAIGALIPYLEDHYHLEYAVVSLVFLSPLLGYTAAALLNNWVHHKVGHRGIGIIGAGSHILAYVVSCLHPPFPLLVVVYVLAGFGNGVEDAAWNAWIGDMYHPNELLGMLHAFYGLGATIAPLVATSIITKAGWKWYEYYYIMIAVASIELVALAVTFWNSDGKVYRKAHPKTTDYQGGRLTEALFKKPAARVSWLVTLFLFGYQGIEVGLGGWIVTFMREVRHGGPFASGMTATGFWLGLTVGRVILGFVTPRIGEKRAVMIYLPLAIAMELCFWLVPQFYVSALTVGFVGFFIGPMFPAGIVALSKLLPKHLHVSAIGFAGAAAGGGGAVFPFAVGAIAQAKGVGVLQPIVLALLAAILLVWIALPRLERKRD